MSEYPIPPPPPPPIPPPPVPPPLSSNPHHSSSENNNISYTQNAPVNPLHPLPAPSFLPYALPLPPPTSSFPYLLYPPPHMIIPAIPESGVDNPEINDPSHAKDVLPIHGNSTTYNLNSLLYNNIMESDYFKALYQLRTYHEVIDEVHASVTHVEPWQAGTSRLASTAFCLLMKFMTLRLTSKQMVGLLETSDSPLVRAIGFLHLRYTAPPATLFGWFEPYLESDEEFSPSADETKRETIGAFCTSLLTNMNYYGTTLPRIPVPIERKIKVLEYRLYCLMYSMCHNGSFLSGNAASP